jgi:hypothetical protein
MSNFDQSYVSYEDCKCTAETEKALLIECPDWDTPEWFPKAHVGEDSECFAKNTVGTFVCTNWIAAQKGRQP